MFERLGTEVTLICIDCLDSKRAINAVELCLKQVPFKNVKFLTSLETEYQYAVKIPHIGSIQEYSRFCIQELHKYFDTSHVLIVQHDGWILNPECWDDSWLEYDYIGCQTGNWGEPGDNGKGGNGGFSLRSKKLSVLTEKICINYHAEDTAISMASGRCNGYRGELEAAGCKIAANNVMFKFGCEIFGGINELREKNTFGQHRCPTSYHPQYSEWFGMKINKKIKSATYGSDTNFIDVTEYVKGMKEIIISNENFGSDPHWGVVKRLRITFEDGSIFEEKEGGCVWSENELEKSTCEIVISRYNEDVSWTKDFQNNKITIYNKLSGENLLPNVGRESHTFLYHIIKNYENLSDEIVFTQAKPYDHCSKEIFCSVVNSKKEFLGVAERCENLPDVIPWGEGEKEETQKWWKELFQDKKYNSQIKATFYGIFKVKKEQILKHPISFYQKAITLGGLDSHSNPTVGHFFERIWMTMLGSENRSMELIRIKNIFSKVIWFNTSPYSIKNKQPPDFSYPHTFIDCEFIFESFLNKEEISVCEIGSFKGGSACKIVEYLLERKIDPLVVCVDTFLGSFPMWRDSKFFKLNHVNGRPSIYDAFISNILSKNFENFVYPLTLSSIEGMKLLKSFNFSFDIVYLDSAHNYDETFLELKNAISLVKDNGVLCGDDWSYDSIRSDVTKFSKELNKNIIVNGNTWKIHF